MKLRNYHIVFLVYILAILPIMILRDFTPSNELRYLSIADEALADNNFFAFTNHGEPYADKPPLYLWGVMLCRLISGSHFMWLLSLLSVIPAIIIVRIFDKWSASEIPQNYRASSQLILLTAGLFLVSSVTLRMDMLMCMFIVLSLREFWRIYSANGNIRLHQWLFPLYIFLAVFTKGPLGFLIPLVATLCFLCLNRRFRLILSVWGWRTWLVLIVLCCAWFGAVYADGGPDYLDNLLFHQTVDRAVKSFHHAAKWYYYLVCFWYCLVPISLVILALIVSAFTTRKRPENLQSFFIVTAVSTLVLLSCISSKIQIYMLPAVPFIVYSAAISFPKYENNVWMRLGAAIIAGIFALALPAFIVVKSNIENPFIESGWFWLTAIGLSVCGLSSLFYIYRRNRKCRLSQGLNALGIGMLVVIFTAGLAMPSLNPYIGFKALADTIENVQHQTGISKVVFLNVKRYDNIDVFLHYVPIGLFDNNDEKAQLDYSQPFILVANFNQQVENATESDAMITGNFKVIPIIDPLVQKTNE